MSEENKKDVEKPQEITEEKVDANAEAGSCTLLTRGGCGAGYSYSHTTRGGCGSITRSGCGFNASWSN